MLYDRNKFILDDELQLQEKLLSELFKSEENITIFDIGACEGESSIRYSRQFPNARVCCFEPIPSNFKLIQHNITEFEASKVQAFEICLSDKDGEAEFHVSSGKPDEFNGKDVDWEFGNKSSSLLPPDKLLATNKWLEFKNEIKVSTIKLDTFLSRETIDQIDFAHMDVQGAELMVLRGAGNKINVIKNIWLEVESIPLYEGQPVKKDVESFMSNLGYVKLIDTVDEVAGDQFWSRREWLISRMGERWVQNRINQIKGKEKASEVGFLQSLRDKIQLRTRLKSLLKG
jgi:FkbM family methyltransferase